MMQTSPNTRQIDAHHWVTTFLNINCHFLHSCKLQDSNLDLPYMSVFQSDDNYLGVRPVYVPAVLGRRKKDQNPWNCMFSHASSALLGCLYRNMRRGRGQFNSCMALGGRV